MIFNIDVNLFLVWFNFLVGVRISTLPIIVKKLRSVVECLIMNVLLIFLKLKIWQECALIGIDSLGCDVRVCSGTQLQTLRFSFKKKVYLHFFFSLRKLLGILVACALDILFSWCSSWHELCAWATHKKRV